jgi:hypothetical protein
MRTIMRTSANPWLRGQRLLRTLPARPAGEGTQFVRYVNRFHQKVISLSRTKRVERQTFYPFHQKLLPLRERERQRERERERESVTENSWAHCSVRGQDISIVQATVMGRYIVHGGIGYQIVDVFSPSDLSQLYVYLP